MNKPVQIFLCHASEDKPKVSEVYRFLKQQGFKPWLDKEDLLPGQRWDQEIPKALKASDFILIFFSQNSVSKRGYVQKEFNLALSVLEEIPEGQIFVIPVRLDACAIPQRFHLLHYCDLFEEGGLDKVVRSIRASLQSGQQGLATAPAARMPSAQSPATPAQVLLRARADESLSVEAVKAMLQKKDFFDSDWHKEGKSLEHRYEGVERNGEKLVIDYATGLTWQQSGSPNYLPYAQAEKYVRELNDQKFTGFNDWRLPTLEEAMSLMERERKNDDLYIDPVFDKTQRYVWTADKESPGVAWDVGFDFGGCNDYYVDDDYVRAVRSGQ